MENHVFEFASATATLKFKNGGFVLTDVNASERRCGHGSGVLKMVVEFADHHGYSIGLEARAYKFRKDEPIMSPDELISFYQKFGFRVTQMRPRIWMLRTPSRKNPALQ